MQGECRKQVAFLLVPRSPPRSCWRGSRTGRGTSARTIAAGSTPARSGRSSRYRTSESTVTSSESSSTVGSQCSLAPCVVFYSETIMILSPDVLQCRAAGPRLQRRGSRGPPGRRALAQALRRCPTAAKARSQCRAVGCAAARAPRPPPHALRAACVAPSGAVGVRVVIVGIRRTPTGGVGCRQEQPC